MIINWDEYFIGVAKLSSLRSKDPHTQVGACIINEDKRIIGIGYNGLPYCCEDNDFPWENNGDFIDTKYPYVVHAEANAILNSTQSLKNATLYVTLFPCNECAKLIIQSRIKEVVYANNKYIDTDTHKASLRMFTAAGIKLRKIEDVEVSLKR